MKLFHLGMSDQNPGTKTLRVVNKFDCSTKGKNHDYFYILNIKLHNIDENCWVIWVNWICPKLLSVFI